MAQYGSTVLVKETRTSHDQMVRRSVSAALIELGQRLSGSTQYGTYAWQNKIEPIPARIDITIEYQGLDYLVTATIVEALDTSTIPGAMA